MAKNTVFNIFQPKLLVYVRIVGASFDFMTVKDWSFKMALSRARIFARLKKTTALQANIFRDIFVGN